MIIFLHVPKTAGTTLARILERQYGARAILRLYQSSYGQELAAIPATQLELLRVVMGNFSFEPHQFLAGPSRYITILREPIDRVISHYYFVRRDPTHYLYETSQRLSLRDFVVACGRDEPNNDQTRLLAGDCGLASSG